MRSEKKVVRIDALWNITSMANFNSFRDGAAKQLPSNAVRPLLSAIECDAAVVAASPWSLEQPASAAALFNLRHEQLARELRWAWRVVINSARHGGYILALLVLCASCSTAPRLPPIKEIQKQYPPATLMEPTPLQSIDVRTNGDLLDARNGAVKALEECNADKAALRAWSQR